MTLLKGNRSIKSGLVFLLIASLLICVACTSYGNAGCSLSARSLASAGKNTHGSARLTALNVSFDCDMATEENLGTSSYQSFSMNRCAQNQNRIFLVFQATLAALLFFTLPNLRTASHSAVHEVTRKALCIARYIEISDGKK